MMRLILLVVLVLVAACQPNEAVNHADAAIVGRWSVVGIYANGTDINRMVACGGNPLVECPIEDQWAEFTPDGQYILRHGDSADDETGRWSFEEKKRYNALHLESQAGAKSQWNVSVDEETMTLARVKEKRFWEQSRDAGWPPETSGYEIVYVRQ